MIDIYNIHYGWLTIKIKDKEFVASYLTNVLVDLDEVIEFLSDDDLSNYHNPKVVYLDGEGREVYLTFWKNHIDDLNIVWEQHGKQNTMEIITFGLKEFITTWKELKNRIKHDYNENFIMDLYDKIK